MAHADAGSNLTFCDCSILNNTSQFHAGGVMSIYATTYILNSTISGNRYPRSSVTCSHEVKTAAIPALHDPKAGSMLLTQCICGSACVSCTGQVLAAAAPKHWRERWFWTVLSSAETLAVTAGRLKSPNRRAPFSASKRSSTSLCVHSDAERSRVCPCCMRPMA